MKQKCCTAFVRSVRVFCVSLTVTVELLLKPIMYLQTSVPLEIGGLGTSTSIYDHDCSRTAF